MGSAGRWTEGNLDIRKAKRIEKTKKFRRDLDLGYKNKEQWAEMHRSSSLQELDSPFFFFTFYILLSPPWNWSARHWQPDTRMQCTNTRQHSTAHITNIYPRTLQTQASNGLIWWIWNQGRTCHNGGWACTIMCMYHGGITIWRTWFGNWRRVRGRY